MSGLTGHVIEYTYDGADSYRVSFGQNTATWMVLTGEHAGDSREEIADVHEVARDVFFVTWLEPTREVVSFVANLQSSEITCSYVWEDKRFFWRGKITAFSRTV